MSDDSPQIGLAHCNCKWASQRNKKRCVFTEGKAFGRQDRKKETKKEKTQKADLSTSPAAYLDFSGLCLEKEKEEENPT